MSLVRKKLMLLGGLKYLVPVIEAAHNLGIYVITVDYIPDNIAHKYSDEYHNVSIIDREAVLKLAKELKIDGIMSFAVDPGVVTAAYVAEKLGLPFQGSYNSVKILQDKALFRDFLTRNGFNVPKAKGYKDYNDVLKDIDSWKFPIIIKPVDSAGSKGVTKVELREDLQQAVSQALENSHKGNIIIEEFIEKKGCSSDSDSFTVGGKLTVCSFSDQYFDPVASNPYTPSAYSWPPTMQKEKQEDLTKELQRLMDLLDMKTGIFNIETRIGIDDKAYIMEVSPRGGGNRLAETVDFIYGSHLIENSVRAAVGLPLIPEKFEIPEAYFAEIIIHSQKEGVFNSLEISAGMRANLIEEDLWVKPGTQINTFKGANNAIGTLVLKFDTREALNNALTSIHIWCKVILK